jgi:hypothetical protein
LNLTHFSCIFQKNEALPDPPLFWKEKKVLTRNKTDPSLSLFFPSRVWFFCYNRMVNMSEQAREPDTSEETPAAKKQKLNSGAAVAVAAEGGGEDAAAASAAPAGELNSMVEELPKEISDALDELDACQRDLDSLNEKVRVLHLLFFLLFFFLAKSM